MRVVDAPTDLPADVGDELREALETERPSTTVPVPLALTPGTRAVCPECRKEVSVTAKGALRVHKCEEPELFPDGANPTVVKAVKVARSGKRGRKPVPAPVNVRKWGVVGLAFAAEAGAEYYVASATGLSRSQIPDEVTALPNPDAMCGPAIDALWPSLPPAVQSQIAKLLEHDALIEACMHWYLYSRTLSQFVAAYHERFPSQPAQNGAQAHVASVKATQGRSDLIRPGAGALADGLTSGRDR